MATAEDTVMHKTERELAPNQFSRVSVHAQLSLTMGEILTLVEASFTDKEQRDSYKNIVRLIFQKRHNWIDELAGFKGRYVIGRGELSNSAEYVE